MKILAINSSYRADRGYSAFLIDLLFEGAREAGAECERIDLAKLRINHCLGCDYCQKHTQLISENAGGNPEYHVECVHTQKDDVQMIFEKMRAADLIIYGTPIYVFNISSLLKLLLERFYGISNCSYLRATQTGLLFHQTDPGIMSKPFVPLIVCDNLEDETPRTARQYFKSFSLFMEARQVGILVRNGGALTGWDVNADHYHFPKLADVYSTYRQAGHELAEAGQISGSTQRRANQDVLPVPFFGILKKIRLFPVKKKFAEKAMEMQISLHK
jgi:multimeric flavodoxin WrbA